MKTEKKEKLIKPKNFCFISFNIIAVSFSILVVVLQATGIWKTYINSKDYQSFLDTLVPVTAALMVGVITILSITISLYKEKIWGISISEFRKLRIGNHFSFLRMIIISLSLTVVNLITMRLYYEINCIAISIVSIGYAIYFCVQEIPILIRDERRLWDIVKRRYRYEIENNAETIMYAKSDNELVENLKVVISYLLFDKTIKKVYNELCYKSKKDKNRNAIILNDLLDKQNTKLFKEKSKNFKLLLLEKDSAVIPISQLYDSVIDNIEIVLSFDEELDIVELLTDSSYYHITRSIFAINNNKIGIKFDEKLTNFFTYKIFYPLAYDKKLDDKKKNFLFRILTTMLSNSVDLGDDWFLKLLREYYTSIQYTINESPNMSEFFIITCWFLDYAQRATSPTELAVKEMVKKFINEEKRENLIRNKTYESVCWKELYRNFNCSINCHFSIKTLLAIYHINEHNWQPTTMGVVHIMSDLLGRKALLNWFFELLFSSDYIFAINFDFEKIFKECCDTEKYEIADYLKYEWLDENDQIIMNRNLEGQKIFETERNVHPYINHQENIKKLVIWVNEEQKKMLETNIKNNDASSLINIKNEMITRVKNKSQELFGFNNQIDLKDEQLMQQKYLCYQIEGGRYVKAIIDSYVNGLSRHIRKLVNETNITKFNREKIDEFINELIKLKPDYCMNWHLTWFDLNLSDENNEKLKQIKCDEIDLYSLLPQHTFLKKDALMFNFEIDENESKVSPCTDEEINTMIDKQFKREDGRYFYKDSNKNIFMTRDELFNIIKDKYFIMQLSFKIKVIIDTTKIIILDKKNN